jgi:hypothetical protein
MERKIVKKWIWIWEYDKEEQWLNAMAQSGWVLDKVGFCRYEFVPCEPGEYTVRLEMRDHDEAYLGFMAETGAEYVGRMVKWIYFRRKVEEGPFDIFSDLDSRLDHVSRIGNLIKVLAVANLVCGVVNSFNPVMHVGWLNLLVCAVLMYGLGRLHGKKEELEKDRLLRE